MKRNTISLAVLFFFIISCDNIKQEAKEAVNKSGEVAGKTATEFIEGVTEGVEQTLQTNLEFTQELKNRGLHTGKCVVKNDSSGGSNNLLVLYLIFDQDVKKDLLFKVFDKNGMEIGRVKKQVEGKAGEAKYYDVAFDKRTYIEVKSKVTVE